MRDRPMNARRARKHFFSFFLFFFSFSTGFTPALERRHRPQHRTVTDSTTRTSTNRTFQLFSLGKNGRLHESFFGSACSSFSKMTLKGLIIFFALAVPLASSFGLCDIVRASFARFSRPSWFSIAHLSDRFLQFNVINSWGPCTGQCEHDWT